MKVFLIHLKRMAASKLIHIETNAALSLESAQAFAIKEYGLNHSCSEMLKNDGFVIYEDKMRTEWTIEIETLNVVEAE